MSRNTILLKGSLSQNFEEKAAGAITPGELVKFDASGNLIRHNVSAGNAAPMFAKEDDLQGKTIDDDYVLGERAHYTQLRGGDEVLAWLTTSQTVIKGDFLESAGNGTLREFIINSGENTDQIQRVVGFALEDKATTGVKARIQVRVV